MLIIGPKQSIIEKNGDIIASRFDVRVEPQIRKFLGISLRLDEDSITI